MFKIDKVAVEYLDTNKSSVVIKQWVNQDVEKIKLAAAMEEEQPRQLQQAFQQPYRQEMDPQAEREIEQKRQEAETVYKWAEQEAERLLTEANAKIEEVFENARQEGYRQGLEEAREQDVLRAQEYGRFFEQLQEVVRQRQDERDAVIERNILELAVAIAKKVINIRLEKDDIVFVGLVKEAIKRLNAKEKFTIHVHEREYERFFQKGSGWLSDAVQCAPFTVVVNADMEPGGLALTSPGGQVDAGVDMQVGKIAAALQVDAQDESDA